jgi:hypothetical protein
MKIKPKKPNAYSFKSAKSFSSTNSSIDNKSSLAIITSATKEDLETDVQLQHTQPLIAKPIKEQTPPPKQLPIANKNIGFSDGFVPIAPVISRIGFNAHNKKQRTHSYLPNDTNPVGIHFIDRVAASTVSTPRTPSKNSQQLGPSQSSKKWIWAGSNGKIDGKAISDWHKYVEQSRK